MTLFQRESELVQAFVPKAREMLERVSGMSIARPVTLLEFDSLHGIADLVLGSCRNNVEARAAVDPNWVAPLAHLKRDSEFSIGGFQEMFCLSRPSALKHLRSYEQAGFLARIDKNRYIVEKQYEPVAELVISVEAKLRDWRRGLYQACRYKRFSDYSFVLLDETHARTALRNLSDFSLNNIGLASLEKDDLNIHYVPQRRRGRWGEHYLRVSESLFHQFKEMVESNSQSDSRPPNDRRCNFDQNTSPATLQSRCVALSLYQSSALPLRAAL